MFILQINNTGAVSGSGSSGATTGVNKPESVLQSLLTNTTNSSASPQSSNSAGSSRPSSSGSPAPPILDPPPPSPRPIRRIRRIVNLLFKIARGLRGNRDEARLKNTLYNLLKQVTGKDITDDRKAGIDNYLNDIKLGRAEDKNGDGQLDYKDIMAIWDPPPPPPDPNKN